MVFKNRTGSKSGVKPQREELFLNIKANRAADLVDRDQLTYHGKPRKINPVLVASINGISKKTKKKLSTNNPSWDQILSLPLRPYDRGSILHLCIWDKHRAYKNYLGELRVDVTKVFTEGSTTKTEPKWHKLFSNSSHHSFVTGSILLSFELVVKRPSRITKKKKTVGEFETDNGNIVVKVEPPSRQHTQEVKLDTLNEMNSSDASLASVIVPENKKQTLLQEWSDSLIYSAEEFRALVVNDQGFYSDIEESEVSESDAEVTSISDKISNKSTKSEESDIQPQELLQRKQKGKDLDHLTSESELSIMSSDVLTSDIDSDVSLSAVTATEDSDASAAISASTNDTGVSDTLRPSPQKKRFSFKGRKHRHKKQTPFEIRNRSVDGVLFMEIVSCTDLPPVRKVAGIGRFDMDPFVVVTFGKQTFRTSWKRHNLNPIFNERLAFEILKSERNFDVNFLVLDKDRFSLHDNVGSVSIPFRDLSKSATAVSKPTYLNEDFGSVDSFDEFTDYESPDNENITVLKDTSVVETMEKKLIRKKLKLKYSDTSKFKTMELNLDLENEKYKDKYAPKLKIRVRYETYRNLRRSFWQRLLDQYSLNDKKTYDYIELMYLLDALGCENSDEVVNKVFDQYGKSQWGGDVMSIDEITDFLEDHVNSTSQSIKLFEIEQCPNCLKKNLSHKKDLDIVTHFAICGSKDWSIVNKLLVSSYVTPQLASKRWFTKVLIKLSYGKYQLGSNSANILVQDRTTGVVLEEKMGVYVRLGIRLLYKGFDHARRRRIRALLKKLSVKQGIKFDDVSSKYDIPSFVKFHKLDLSECLQPDVSKYDTFNDFFYRRLKPNARPLEGGDNDDDIVASPADCRCVAFDSVDEATELWIKGRNFTIAKLFNGNFNNLEGSQLYKANKCAVGVFRLAPQDYHRFHSPVSGTIKEIKFIDGEYYTVNPMAIRSELDVFGENVRALIAIETENFGTVVMVPVGAMMVGSIILTKKAGEVVKKGEEMGYFKFGGSTVILLFDKAKFKFDSDLVNNSNTCVETLIRVGQSIGHVPDRKEYARDHIDFGKLSKMSRKNLIRVITGGDLADFKEIKSWESTKLAEDMSGLELTDDEEEEDEGEDDGDEGEDEDDGE